MTDGLSKKYAPDIVTHHNMEKLPPVAKPSSREAGVESVPDMIGFELEDGTVLMASTEREISVGRRSRPEDPHVIVDLQPYGGYQQGVSRYHAMVTTVRGEVVLRDLTSVNGTFLNGYKLSPVKRYTVADGDMITFGQMSIKIRFVFS